VLTLAPLAWGRLPLRLGTGVASVCRFER